MNTNTLMTYSGVVNYSDTLRYYLLFIVNVLYRVYNNLFLNMNHRSCLATTTKQFALLCVILHTLVASASCSCLITSEFSATSGRDPTSNKETFNTVHAPMDSCRVELCIAVISLIGLFTFVIHAYRDAIVKYFINKLKQLTQVALVIILFISISRIIYKLRVYITLFEGLRFSLRNFVTEGSVPYWWYILTTGTLASFIYIFCVCSRTLTSSSGVAPVAQTENIGNGSTRWYTV